MNIGVLARELAPALILFTAVTAFVAYVFIKTPHKYYLKFLLIPVSLVSFLVALFTISLSLGHAYPSELPAKFVYLGHNVIVKNNKKTSIEVWAKEKDTRLYLIPYTKQVEKALDGAAGMKGKGGRVEMNKKKSGDKVKGHNKGEIENDDIDDYESNLRLPSDDNPKDLGVAPTEESRSLILGADDIAKAPNKR